MSGINPEKAERLKSLLTPRVFIAVFLWAVTCAALCFVEFRMYGGAVKTVFMYALMTPLVHVLGWLFSGGRKKKEMSRRRKKIGAVIWTIFCIGLTFITWLSLLRMPYLWLSGLQSLAVIIAAFPSTVLEGWRGSSVRLTASVVACSFAAILLITGLYLLIAAPATIADAERTLRDEGYQVTKYTGYVPPNTNKEHGGFFTGGRKVEMGAYIFNSERSGEGYLVYVGVKTGEIYGEMSFDEYPRLAR